MRILLVDESEVDRLAVERDLMRLGHDVLVATTGREAVDRFLHETPDLVLLDEILPDMRVGEAVRQLRQIREEWVPILVLSAQGDPADLLASVSAGADDCLLKAGDGRILEAKLKVMQRIAEMRGQLVERVDSLSASNLALQRLVDVDSLTALANRRYLDRMLAHEIARCGRSREPIAILMCDVDEFKNYNDFYGHPVGDDALRQVAKVLRCSFRRATDVVARYGGEEFVAILPGTEPAMAEKLAEHMRQRLAKLALPHARSTVSSYLTLSIGIYCAVPSIDSAADEFLVEADRALYCAKQEGRDRIVLNAVGEWSAIQFKELA